MAERFDKNYYQRLGLGPEDAELIDAFRMILPELPPNPWSTADNADGDSAGTGSEIDDEADDAYATGATQDPSQREPDSMLIAGGLSNVVQLQATRRVLVMSDIHGNLAALEAVLARADELGVVDAWCLGDVLGYGPFPHECQRLVEERCSIILAGNHDLAVFNGRGLKWFNDGAAAGVRYSREQVFKEGTAAGARAGRWPSDVRLAGGEIVLAHGAPSPFDPVNDYAFAYVAPEDILTVCDKARLVLVGHHHVPMCAVQGGLDPEEPKSAKIAEAPLTVFESEDGQKITFDNSMRVVANPGSVGQPRDGDPRAHFAIVTLAGTGEPIAFEWHRVDYDIEATVSAMRKTRLPGWLADRLRRGE